MIKISKQDIQHLAQLSSIELLATETEALESSFKKLLNQLKILEELDTSQVEPTYQVGAIKNVWRADQIVEQSVTPEQLVDLSKNSLDRQIKVPKVL